jgi:hypothetical protein
MATATIKIIDKRMAEAGIKMLLNQTGFYAVLPVTKKKKLR